MCMRASLSTACSFATSRIGPAASGVSAPRSALRRRTIASSRRSVVCSDHLRRVVSAPMRQRAVLFDLDNTLVMEDAATFAAVRSACAVASSRAGADADALFAALLLVAEKLWKGSPALAYADRMGIWWGEGLWGEFRGEASELGALRAFVPGFRRAVWSEALTAIGVSEETLAQELAETYRTARSARQLVDAEAQPLLDALARDHRLALVSNGAPDVQREKLAGTTLGRYFGAIVISCEVGFGKPDRRIFEIALERIGANAHETVMVGDSLARDVAGAPAGGPRAGRGGRPPRGREAGAPPRP